MDRRAAALPHALTGREVGTEVETLREIAAAAAAMATEVSCAAAPADMWPALARWSVSVVPGAEHACVARCETRGWRTLTSTHGGLERWSRDGAARGIASEALAHRRPSSIDDLELDTSASDARLTRLPGRGIRSLLALPLDSGDDPLDLVLILAAGRCAAFGEPAHSAATLFAAQAGLALKACSARRKAEHLELALASSREIGAATGILMARDLVTRDQAFDLLRRASQTQNRKLSEVAAAVVHSGQLDGRSSRPRRERKCRAG